MEERAASRARIFNQTGCSNGASRPTTLPVTLVNPLMCRQQAPLQQGCTNSCVWDDCEVG